MTAEPSRRVAAVRWRPFRLPMRHRFEASHSTLTDREGLILELLGDDGDTGIGEASPIEKGALAGLGLGLGFAWLAGRSSSPDAAREILPATWVGWMLVGGSVYRAHDHVEAGTRIAAAVGIAAAALALGFASFVLLRRRPRLAAGIPALAPALACAAMLAVSSRGGPAALSTKDSVLLVLVDTLRADIADGRFATDPDAMPELARIAAAGTRFTQAVSPAPWTLPANQAAFFGGAMFGKGPDEQ